MTTETLHPERRTGASRGAAAPPASLHRLAAAAAWATFLLVIAGGAVTSTESGMADPHWPSFGGRWLPSLEEMARDRGLFYEHGHRLIAAGVGLLTWVLAGCFFLREGRRWVRVLAGLSGLTVLALALLGGATVKLHLPPAVSISHVSLALLFLVVNTSLAVVTGRGWFEETAPLGPEDARSLSVLALVTLAMGWVQAVLGAVARHATPEAGGELMVWIGDGLHITWAFGLFAVGMILFGRILGRFSKQRRLLAPALLLGFLLVLQFFTGFVAFIGQPKDPATAPQANTPFHEGMASFHQALGALFLMAAAALALHALRIRRLSLERAASDAAAGDRR